MVRRWLGRRDHAVPEALTTSVGVVAGSGATRFRVHTSRHSTTAATTVAAVANNGSAAGTATGCEAEVMSIARVAGVIATASSAAMRRWPPRSRMAIGHIRY